MKSVYSSHSFDGKPPGKGIRFVGAPVTKWLLIVLSVFLVIDVSGRNIDQGRIGYLLPYLALEGGLLHQVWRWITYPFVSLNMGEWLFSMITLFVFGKFTEQALGSRRFTVLLGFTTCIGAVVYAMMSSIGGGQSILTGVNGFAIATLVAMAILHPEQVVQLMIPPIPLKVKNLVIGLIAIMVVMSIAQRADPAITLSHLSAIGVSFFCLKNRHWLDVGLKKKPSRKKSKYTSLGVKKKSAKKKSVGMKARTILNMEVSKREAEIDKILDKVSAEGIGNLTEEEREILKFASKK